VYITGTVTYAEEEHDHKVGDPVFEGTIKIQQNQDGSGNPAPCPTSKSEENYVDIASGTPNENGQLTTVFDTTGLGGKTIGFRFIMSLQGVSMHQRQLTALALTL